MKVTFMSSPPSKVEFKRGDYFKTEFGSIRQVVQGRDGKYMIMGLNGTCPTDVVGDTPTSTVKKYIKSNGPVEKLIAKEIIFDYTDQSIKGVIL